MLLELKRHSADDKLATCAGAGATTSADERIEYNAVGNTSRGKGFSKDVTRILRNSSAVAGAKDDRQD
jgi:hypothetical protein